MKEWLHANKKDSLHLLLVLRGMIAEHNPTKETPVFSVHPSSVSKCKFLIADDI